ncbi:MAG: cytochrome c biogenesis protein CcsA [Prevotellaceae bacterium]|jgi:cytochrome c biogenesis factor|nr:cytochrome c biogenesis protein CcsA [Prevotellaceae bacterium]
MKSLFKWTSFGGLIALAVIMATATVVEKVFGREQAITAIYGAWWFVAVWMITAASAAVYLVQKKIFKRKAAALLHIALLVILAGALVTFLTAERGALHIRQGQILNYYISDKDNARHPLPFNIKLLLFEVEHHPDSSEPADFISYLRVDGEVCRVSMNRIYRHKGYRLYQLEYDDDEMGTTLLLNHDPWGIPVTYTGYLLLAIAAVWLLFLRLSWKGVTALALPTVAVWFYISQINPMTPVLRSPLLAIHVSIIMISYVLLLTAASVSGVALCSKRLAQRLLLFNRKLLYPALFLLAMGIFIGAIWANISWGRYWGWDSKETWALITLIVYAIPMHAGSLKAFGRPKFFHRYMLFAILAVAMTFLGVSFLMEGMHSYL